MTTSLIQLFQACLILVIVQGLAALPWIIAFDRKSFFRALKDPIILAYIIGSIVGFSALFAWFISGRRIEKVLIDWGRVYGAVLHAQLALDMLVIMPQILLLISPKIGAVALSAFREGWRQPMFWLIAVLTTILLFASMTIPYFTFGEDYKMMKQLGFDLVMLSSALFGLLAASLSINEEIEGRTAITVISKPINRRQFLLGKYLGTLMACWAMTLVLGWVLNLTLYIKPHFDRLDDVFDSMPIEMTNKLTPILKAVVPTAEIKSFSEGTSAWLGESIAHHTGLVMTFGQVMVLLAICIALATRMQFVVNLVICLFIFFLGHLAPVLVLATQQMAQGTDALKLVNFIAQLLNAIFPSLQYFDMGPAIVRDSDLVYFAFLRYVVTVCAYAILYSAIGLFIGLILFEDRDLA